MYNDISNQQLIDLYKGQRLTLRQIGKKYKVSHQNIHQRLKRLGIARNSLRVQVNCNTCGKSKEITYARSKKQENHYCNMDCLAMSKEKGHHKIWRREQRVSRVEVGKYFKLSGDHVIDYLDGNNKNNDINNLVVYGSEGDRLKAKQGHKIPLVWSGKSELIE
jgi:hypothetical protein